MSKPDYCVGCDCFATIADTSLGLCGDCLEEHHKEMAPPSKIAVEKAIRRILKTHGFDSCNDPDLDAAVNNIIPALDELKCFRG